MSSSYTWRALPLSPSADIPALLVSIDLGTAAYTIRVTDLANIWAESLDRKQICMRAWGENTSIDPSDTPENMTKFLDSLRSALDPSHQHHAKTSMSLSPGDSSSEVKDNLTLSLTCELPGLSTLKWPVQLKKMPSTSLANDLVLPLVQAQDVRAREIQLLTELLSQKDSVISRLLDKLESTGTGLENVFNALSSKKKVSRAVAETKVKGLAPFDKANWQGDSTSSHHESENAATLLSKVFGDDGLELSVASGALSKPDSDNWWHDLKTTVQIPLRTQPSKPKQSEGDEPPTPNTENEDEDDFQFQPSSPIALPSKQDANDHDVDDVSTASESGEDEAEVKHTTKTTAKATSGRIGRLGGVGARKHAEKQPSPPARNAGKKKEVLEVEGSETATDVSDDEDSSKLPKSSPEQTKSSAPSRGKIGRVGARHATPVSHVEPEAPSSKREGTPDAPNQSHAPKLGMIGKGSKKGSVIDSEVDNERGRKVQTQAAEPSHRETSIERADRRREELKRELEKKAAAGPTKKKRKF